jgi:hypothetical protein
MNSKYPYYLYVFRNGFHLSLKLQLIEKCLKQKLTNLMRLILFSSKSFFNEPFFENINEV